MIADRKCWEMSNAAVPQYSAKLEKETKQQQRSRTELDNAAADCDERASDSVAPVGLRSIKRAICTVSQDGTWKLGSESLMINEQMQLKCAGSDLDVGPGSATNVDVETSTVLFGDI